MDKIDRISRIGYVFLLGYITLIPFYYLPAVDLFGIKIQIMKFLPAFLISFLFGLVFLKGQLKFKDLVRDKLSGYILIYFFLTMLSGLGTTYYPVSMVKAVYYYGLTGTLIYFIIYSWKLERKLKLYFLRSMAMFAFIASLYGIITFIIGYNPLFGEIDYPIYTASSEFWLSMGRVSSTFGNPHFLGTFLSAIFPVVIYLHMHKTKQKKTPDYFGKLNLVVIFFTIALTFSIGAFLSVIFVFVCCLTKPKVLKKDVITGLHLGVILLCAIMGIMATNILLNLAGRLPMLFGKVFGRIDFYQLANIQGFAGRWEGLKHVLSYLSSHYFFGIGVVNTAVDNFYLLSLAENGLIGFTFMLAVLYLIVRAVYQKINNSVSSVERELSFFLSIGCVSFFINMFFWDVFSHLTMRVLFWSLVGLLITEPKAEKVKVSL